MYAIYGNIYHPYTPNVSIYTSTMDPGQSSTNLYPPSLATAARRKTCSSSSPSPHWERHRHCNASGPATLPSFSSFSRMKRRWAKCQTLNWEIHKSTFSMDLLEGKFIDENYGAPYAFCICPKGLYFRQGCRETRAPLSWPPEMLPGSTEDPTFRVLQFCTIQCGSIILIHTS